MTGKLISFEGPEGAGKTSVLQEICKRLESVGIDFIHTREPGGIPIAEKIRSVILDTAYTAMDGRTEALLYAAARRQHLVEKILPALEQGKWVLCDRYIDSSLAYQGAARGIGMEAIWSINQFAIQDHLPQLTIFFDISPAKGLARIAQNNRESNRLDQESLAFHEAVYGGYQALLAEFPQRIKAVDASQSIEKVTENVWKVLESQFMS